MKLLHREIKSCMSCPFMSIVGDTTMTVIACKNREAAPGGNEFNARVILRQPMSHVIADVAIPEWCPLPDLPATAQKKQGGPEMVQFVMDGTGAEGRPAYMSMEKERFDRIMPPRIKFD